MADNDKTIYWTKKNRPSKSGAELPERESQKRPPKWKQEKAKEEKEVREKMEQIRLEKWLQGGLQK